MLCATHLLGRGEHLGVRQRADIDPPRPDHCEGVADREHRLHDPVEAAEELVYAAWLDRGRDHAGLDGEVRPKPGEDVRLQPDVEPAPGEQPAHTLHAVRRAARRTAELDLAQESRVLDAALEPTTCYGEAALGQPSPDPRGRTGCGALSAASADHQLRGAKRP